MAGPTVTFRMPAVALFPVPAGLAVAGLGLLARAQQRHSPVLGSSALYLLLLSVAILAINVLLRVQLSPAGVRIRALGRTRLVGWAQISAVTVEPDARRGRRVALWTTSGPPVRLPLPLGNGTWNEPAFLRGYHQIGQYWLAHQRPDGHLPGQR